MLAYMACYNFSVNRGMLARNGVIQGLPAYAAAAREWEVVKVSWYYMELSGMTPRMLNC